MICVYSSIELAYWSALRARTNSALPSGFQPSNCVIVVSVTISPSELMPKSSSLAITPGRSEEHTSELQSRLHLVCRLLLEKKKKNKKYTDLNTEMYNNKASVR